MILVLCIKKGGLKENHLFRTLYTEKYRLSNIFALACTL